MTEVRISSVRIKSLKEKILGVGEDVDGEIGGVTSVVEVTFELPSMTRNMFLRVARAWLHKQDIGLTVSIPQTDMDLYPGLRRGHSQEREEQYRMGDGLPNMGDAASADGAKSAGDAVDDLSSLGPGGGR